MRIETKFNVNDDVYLIYNNKVVSSTIAEVKVTVKKANKTETYGICGIIDMAGHYDYIPDNKLFKTKEGLINSL